MSLRRLATTAFASIPSECSWYGVRLASISSASLLDMLMLIVVESLGYDKVMSSAATLSRSIVSCLDGIECRRLTFIKTTEKELVVLLFLGHSETVGMSVTHPNYWRLCHAKICTAYNRHHHHCVSRGIKGKPQSI